MNPRRAFIGIDFSGAQNAGKSIWIAEAAATPCGVAVHALASAADRLGAAKLESVLPALAEHLAEQADAAVGIDAPFSLPRALIDEPTWPDWLAAYSSNYPDPETLRASCLERAGRKELKRATDREQKTPFAAYNLRLYKQTHYLVADVLAPLVESRRACALPMQHDRDDLPATTPWLLEACPASTLRAELGESAGYKGTTDVPRRAPRGDHPRARDTRTHRVGGRNARVAESNAGGDALDASLAALAARRAMDDPAGLHAEPGSVGALEGRVYC